MTKLSDESGRLLRAAITWAAGGEQLELVDTLGQLDPEQLDAAIEVWADVLEKLRNLRAAHRGRTAERLLARTSLPNEDVWVDALTI